MNERKNGGRKRERKEGIGANRLARLGAAQQCLEPPGGRRNFNRAPNKMAGSKSGRLVVVLNQGGGRDMPTPWPVMFSFVASLCWAPHLAFYFSFIFAAIQSCNSRA